METPAVKRTEYWVPILLACLTLGGLVSVLLGQDANWDLRNYHIYNAWAFLNGRMQQDMFPAGIQTYLSPLMDLPYFMLSSEWLPNRPRQVAFLMGVPYGLLIFLVLFISWVSIGHFEKSSSRRAIAAALATLFGVSGVATVSQAGTTFNEVQNAALVLLSVALILSRGSATSRSRVRSLLLFLLAGAFMGAAAGFKLTAALYAPGAALGILLLTQDRRQSLRNLCFFAGGWTAAFLLVWGPWAYGLYGITGNPFFPFLNSVFQSPWMAPVSWSDTRFLPKSALQVFFYPYFWIVRNNTVMEPVFADPRFAIAMTVGLAWGIVALYRVIVAGARGVSAFTLGREGNFLLVFLVISYAIWQSLWSILRYAVTIECLLGTMIILMAYGIFTRPVVRDSSFRYSAVVVLMFGLLSISAGTTAYPEWGRVEYAKSVFEVSEVTLPPRSAVLLLGPPTAYLAPMIAAHSIDVRFLEVYDTPLAAPEFAPGQRLRQSIAEHSGPLYVLAPSGATSMDPLQSYGLQPAEPCDAIRSNIADDALLCPLVRMP
jgi:hypothetical protein